VSSADIIDPLSMQAINADSQYACMLQGSHMIHNIATELLSVINGYVDLNGRQHLTFTAWYTKKLENSMLLSVTS